MLAVNRWSRSSAQAYTPKAVTAGNRLAGRERRKSCSSRLVMVSWTRCSPGDVGSLSAKPRV
jgi:hypothetical protein